MRNNFSTEQSNPIKIQRLSEFDAHGNLIRTVQFQLGSNGERHIDALTENQVDVFPQKVAEYHYNASNVLIQEEAAQPQRPIIIRYDHIGRRVIDNRYALFREPEEARVETAQNSRSASFNN